MAGEVVGVLVGGEVARVGDARGAAGVLKLGRDVGRGAAVEAGVDDVDDGGVGGVDVAGVEPGEVAGDGELADGGDGAGDDLRRALVVEARWGPGKTRRTSGSAAISSARSGATSRRMAVYWAIRPGPASTVSSARTSRFAAAGGMSPASAP